MAIASRESRVVGWWIIMLPQTAVHWQRSAGVGAKFGAEQLPKKQKFRFKFAQPG